MQYRCLDPLSEWSRDPGSSRYFKTSSSLFTDAGSTTGGLLCYLSGVTHRVQVPEKKKRVLVDQQPQMLGKLE